MLTVFLTSATSAHATVSFVPAPYTEPNEIACVEGSAHIDNDQKFSRKEKIVIVLVDISYRWHISSVNEDTVTFQLQKDVNPTNNETWVNVQGVTRTQDIPDCSPTEEEPTPTPTVDQGSGWSPTPEGNNSTTGAPGVCQSKPIGGVASINVLQGDPNDGTVTVQWSLPLNADHVHVIYGEQGSGWQHALLNAQNTGSADIHLLKNGVKYTFAVAGVNGCAVGKWSAGFTQLP